MSSDSSPVENLDHSIRSPSTSEAPLPTPPVPADVPLPKSPTPADVPLPKSPTQGDVSPPRSPTLKGPLIKEDSKTPGWVAADQKLARCLLASARIFFLAAEATRNLPTLSERELTYATTYLQAIHAFHDQRSKIFKKEKEEARDLGSKMSWADRYRIWMREETLSHLLGIHFLISYLALFISFNLDLDTLAVFGGVAICVDVSQWYWDRETSDSGRYVSRYVKIALMAWFISAVPYWVSYALFFWYFGHLCAFLLLEEERAREEADMIALADLVAFANKGHQVSFRLTER